MNPDDVCDVCDDTGTYHMDDWGYAYGGSDCAGTTAHPCLDCHRERRWRADHVEAVEDELDLAPVDASEAVDAWFASDGSQTVMAFAANWALTAGGAHDP